MVTKVFELFIAATGLSKEQAAGEGYDAISVSITKADRASYYPGGRDNHICLIVDKKQAAFWAPRASEAKLSPEGLMCWRLQLLAV